MVTNVLADAHSACAAVARAGCARTFHMDGQKPLWWKPSANALLEHQARNLRLQPLRRHRHQHLLRHRILRRQFRHRTQQLRHRLLLLRQNQLRLRRLHLLLWHTPTPAAPAAPKRPPIKTVGAPKVLRTLTAEEAEARERALVEARQRDVEDKKRAEIEAVERVEREAREAAERVENEAEEARRTAKRAADAEAKQAAAELKASKAAAATETEADAGRSKSRRPAGGADKPATPPKPRNDADRRRGKLTVSNALNDDGGRARSLAAFRRRQERQKKQARGGSVTKEKVAREVTIPEVITIQELANRMSERAVDVIKFLMKEGEMHTINDVVDTDTAQLIAEEFGHTVKRVSEV